MSIPHQNQWDTTKAVYKREAHSITGISQQIRKEQLISGNKYIPYYIYQIYNYSKCIWTKFSNQKSWQQQQQQKQDPSTSCLQETQLSCKAI